MTIRNAFAIALLALAAAGCSKPAEEHEAATAGGEEHAQSSSAGLPSGNAAAGEKLANTKRGATNQACVECHGPHGNAPIDASYPRLAGQYADYIANSLQGYRGGKREHALMSAQAKDLTDQQIADLAAYFDSQQGGLSDLTDMHHK